LYHNRLFELLCILRPYSLPTFVDLRIFNSLLNRWSVYSLRIQSSRRCCHVKLIALPDLAVFRLRICRPIEFKLNLLDVLIGPSLYIPDWWTEAIDHVVVGNDIRDVRRLPDDLNVSFGALDVLRIVGFPPMRITDEGVGSWSDAVMRVGPG
jgi:hypothetical protein